MGHFLYGDKVKAVKEVYRVSDSENKEKIYLELEWERRKIGEQFQILNNTIIDTDSIIEYDPDFLLNYYERSIQSTNDNI